MSTAVRIEHKDVEEIPFQEASLDIWDKKYRLDRQGRHADRRDDGRHLQARRARPGRRRTRARAARALVRAFPLGAAQAARSRPAASRRTPARWSTSPRPRRSTAPCPGTIRDSMDDILDKVHEAGLTLKAGCGIGYEFSTLRPRGAYVVRRRRVHLRARCRSWISTTRCASPCRRPAAAAARRWAPSTSAIRTRWISSAPSARTAGCASSTCRCWSPTSSCEAVRERPRLAARLPAVAARNTTPEQHDLRRRHASSSGASGRRTRATSRDDDGLVACKIYKTLPARRMWDVIMSSTYDFAEPGFVLIDRVNEMNNNWWCENIRATNPCGEQPLPPYGSCLLGSVNLTRFVRDPFTDEARFDWDEYREVVQRVHPHARQRGRDQRPAARAAARRDHAQAPPRHGLPGPGLAPSPCSA